MSYSNEILNVLREANPEKGLHKNSIVRHVYNMTSLDLFNSRPYETVKAEILKYLRNESALKGGAVERTEQRGFYRLNKNSHTVQQLLLQFEISEDDDWMM